jgi:hypothetical protein
MIFVEIQSEYSLVLVLLFSSPCPVHAAEIPAALLILILCWESMFLNTHFSLDTLSQVLKFVATDQKKWVFTPVRLQILHIVQYKVCTTFHIFTKVKINVFICFSQLSMSYFLPSSFNCRRNPGKRHITTNETKFTYKKSSCIVVSETRLPFPCIFTFVFC